MKHTNETLSKLTKHEINKLVAEIVGFTDIQDFCEKTDEVYGELNGTRFYVDYCNDPELAMAIAKKNKMIIEFENKGVSLYRCQELTQSCYVSYSHKNAYCRAICTCLILMNQDK